MGNRPTKTTEDTSDVENVVINQSFLVFFAGVFPMLMCVGRRLLILASFFCKIAHFDYNYIRTDIK